MFFVLGFLFPVAEVVLVMHVIRMYGFANAFFAWLVATILGIGLVRTSGLRLTVGVAQAMREGKPPGIAALEGALIGLAGLLLLLPGYISDAAAVMLLVPPMRRHIAKRVANAVAQRTGFAATEQRSGASAGPWSKSTDPYAEDVSSSVIDVEAVVVEDDDATRPRPSLVPPKK